MKKIKPRQKPLRKKSTSPKPKSRADLSRSLHLKILETRPEDLGDPSQAQAIIKQTHHFLLSVSNQDPRGTRELGKLIQLFTVLKPEPTNYETHLQNLPAKLHPVILSFLNTNTSVHIHSDFITAKDVKINLKTTHKLLKQFIRELFEQDYISFKSEFTTKIPSHH